MNYTDIYNTFDTKIDNEYYTELTESDINIINQTPQ